MPPGEGFRIPIVIDFTESMRNVTAFRAAVGQAFSEIGARTQSALDAGVTPSPRAITGGLARQLGAAQAAVNQNPELLPSQREDLLKFNERQMQAELARIRRMPGLENVRAPTQNEVRRSTEAAEKQIVESRQKEARAAQRAAEAAERSARAEEEKARASQRADAQQRAAETATTNSYQAMAAAAAKRARDATAAGRAGQAGPTTLPTGAPSYFRAAIPQAGQFGQGFGVPIPDASALDKLRQMLSFQSGISPNVFSRLGEQAGLQRIFGLNVGLAEENDPTFRGAEAQEKRLDLTLTRRIRELEERSDVERALIANERKLLTQTAQLSVTMKERQLAQRAEAARLAGTDLDQPLADDRLTRMRQYGRVSERVAADTTPEIAEELGRTKAAVRGWRNRIDRNALQEEAASDDLTREAALTAQARRAHRRRVNQADREIQDADPNRQRGTLTQRAQAFIANRQGGPPRAETEFLNFRQLIASRAITTASFAASGAILYGSLQFARELVTEATELQIQLGIVNSQLAEAGDVGSLSFGRVRDEILSISRESGVMATQVALVTRQLAGAFATPEGQPDFGRALTEARSAFQLGRVTGLPDQEITDSLTAVSLAFEETDAQGRKVGPTFEQIGDTIIGLEQRFGVLAPEIVKFTADLAPLGAELGFTVTQLSALGAVAQQVSGRSGAVLSEQFGRILPALADRSADLLILFQENEETARQIPQLASALASRDLPAVLTQLVLGYENFTAAQQNTLVSMVGSRREAAAFYALLSRGQQTVRALSTTPDEFTGQQGRRFEDFSETVKFSFEQAQRAVEEFGIALFEAGLGDLLVGVGQGLELVAATAGGVLGILKSLNDLTDGWAGTLIAAVAGLAALNKTLVVTAALMRTVRDSQAISTVGRGLAGSSFLGRGGAAAGAAASTPAWWPGGAAAGAAGATASRGFLGSAALAGRGFLAANGPGLVLLAGIIGKSIRDQGQKDLAEGVDFLRQQTRQALERGVDPSEIRRIAAEGQSSLGTFDKLNLFIHGQPDIEAVSEREIGLFYKELREKQLEAIQEAQRLAEIRARNAAIEAGRSTEAAPAPVDYSVDGGAIDYSAFDKPASYTGQPDVVAANQEVTDRFLRMLREERDPAEAERRAAEIIESQNDPQLRALLTEMQTEFDAGVKEAEQRFRASTAATERLGDEGRQESLTALRAAVSEGTVAPQRLIARLQQDAKDMDVVIAELRRLSAGDPENEDLAKYLQEVLTNRETILDEIETLADKAVIQAPDLRIRIRSSLNLEGAGEANLADLRQIIEGLEGINPEEQLERVFQGIEMLAEMAEAAGETSFEIPDEWRRILVRAQLPGLVASEEGQRIADLLGYGIDTLTRELEVQLAQVGNDASKISAAIQAGRRRMLDRIRGQIREAFQGEQRRMSADAAERAGAAVGAEEGALAEVGSALDAELGRIIDSIVAPSVGNVSGDGEDPDDLARRIAEAQLAIRRAQANGDPVLLARLAQEAAAIQGRFAKDEAEELQAFAASIEANNQLRDAQADYQSALAELMSAQRANDAVAVAYIGSVQARDAVRNAKGETARVRAMAQQVTADRATRDAVRDVFAASQELLIAVANAAGDTVGAAEIQLGLARQRLQDLQSEGAGQAELDRARAEIVASEAAVRDAQFNDQIGDIDFLLEMEKISIQQAIRMLEAMKRVPGATEEMIRTIERRIKGLQDELGRDYQFNLPSNLELPTLYEARRLNQSQQAGLDYNTGGLAGRVDALSTAATQYQDNRVITLEFSATNLAEAEAIRDSIVEEFNRPPRFGTASRPF